MNYREEVLRTAGVSLKEASKEQQYQLGALGLSEEAGEVTGLVKKFVYHKKPLDQDKLLKELGDVRWYFEYLLISLGFTMEQVEAANAEKLRARYPNGFNPEDAAKRMDENK